MGNHGGMTFDPPEDRPRPAEVPPAPDAPTTKMDVEQATELDLRPPGDAGETREHPAVTAETTAPAGAEAEDLGAEAEEPGQRTEDIVAIDPPASADDDLVRELRNVEFPLSLRGYNTQAVDRYVERVERSIARFDENRRPTEAVRRALDRVGEQTSAILREAERSAEETTRASRAKADDRLQRAEREAAELWATAQERAKALDEDIERLWQERQRLIEATRELANRLHGTADHAEATFPPEVAPSSESAGSVRAASRAEKPSGDDEPHVGPA